MQRHIDALRGAAILMVILVHTSQVAPADTKYLKILYDLAQLGVQLFFVVSAYTLSQSWINRGDEPHQWRNYGLRRFFRIAPLYYCGLLLYLGLSIVDSIMERGVIAPAEQYKPLNIAANILLLQGLYPAANNTVVPGGWSIGTEVVFYALFPMAAAAILKRRLTTLAAAGILVCCMAASLFLLYLTELFTGRTVANNNFAYFSIFTQGPVFICGILFFHLNASGRWLLRSEFSNILGFGLFSAGTLWLWLAERPSNFSLIPTVAALSFVCLFKLFELVPGLSHPLLVRAGQASYSMYLLHFVFAVRLSGVLAPEMVEALGGDATALLLSALTTLLTFAIAEISRRSLEAYFIALGQRVISRLDA